VAKGSEAAALDGDCRFCREIRAAANTTTTTTPTMIGMVQDRCFFDWRFCLDLEVGWRRLLCFFVIDAVTPFKMGWRWVCGP
jgi:hypothetical protein